MLFVLRSIHIRCSSAPIINILSHTHTPSNTLTHTYHHTHSHEARTYKHKVYLVIVGFVSRKQETMTWRRWRSLLTDQRWQLHYWAWRRELDCPLATLLMVSGLIIIKPVVTIDSSLQPMMLSLYPLNFLWPVLSVQGQVSQLINIRHNDAIVISSA